jgi:predicted nucleic acid-binding protein
MAFVLDTSIALAWMMEDEVNASAEAAWTLARQERTIMTQLFFSEVRNAILVAGRRGRITREAADRLHRFTKDLAPVSAAPARDSDVVDVARRHVLTAYDAEFLELSLRLRLPLATLDRALIRAAESEGVPLTAPHP